MKNIAKLFSGWNRSEHMRMLHAQGRYKNVDTRIGEWNKSDERKERMSRYYQQNHLDRTSHGFGSQYHMRQRSRELLHNKFQGESGYLYLLDFPNSIKVGFSKDWERRTTKQILGGKVLKIISGPTNDLADLEFDTFMKFQDYTKVDQTGTHYTEYLEKSKKSQVSRFLDESVKNNKNLTLIVNNNF